MYSNIILFICEIFHMFHIFTRIILLFFLFWCKIRPAILNVTNSLPRFCFYVMPYTRHWRSCLSEDSVCLFLSVNYLKFQLASRRSWNQGFRSLRKFNQLFYFTHSLRGRGDGAINAKVKWEFKLSWLQLH